MYSNKPLCKNAERFLLFEIDIKKDLWYSITSKFFGCIKVSKNLLSSCNDFKAVNAEFFRILESPCLGIKSRRLMC